MATPGSLVVRLEYRNPEDPATNAANPAAVNDQGSFPNIKPILIYCSGSKFLTYEELDSLHTQPTDRSLDGYRHIKLYDRDPTKPVAAWDVPNAVHENKGSIDKGKISPDVLSLVFAQRCFLSKTGRVSWVLRLTSSKSKPYSNQIEITLNKAPSFHDGPNRQISDILEGPLQPTDSNTISPDVILFGRQFKSPNALRVTFGSNGRPRYELTIKEQNDKDRDFGGGLLRLSQNQFGARQELEQVDVASDSDVRSKRKVWMFGLDDLSSNTVIKDVWNRQVAKPYSASVETALGGSRTSFIPYWDETNIPNVDWVATFHFDDGSDDLIALKSEDFYVADAGTPNQKQKGVVKSQLISVLPKGPLRNMTARVEGVQCHDGSPFTFRCDLVAPAPPDQRVPWGLDLLPATVVGHFPSQPALVRSGALDLAFQLPADLLVPTVSGSSAPEKKVAKAEAPGTQAAQLSAGRLRWRFTPHLNKRVCPADLNVGGNCLLPEVEYELRLRPKDVQPGGQDDIASAEFAQSHELIHTHNPGSAFQTCDDEIESNYEREAPLVLRRPGISPPSAGNWYLEIQEQLFNLKSQTLRMTLGLERSDAPHDDAVIVIDRQPLTVAEVRFHALTQRKVESAVVAEWSNANGRGSSWRLIQLDEAEPKIVMPPQIVGEEMVREKLLCKSGENETKCQDRLLDFRFSPPTVLTLRRSEQRYVEAPWNLRRLLTDDKVNVRQLSYELLYGMACTAEYPYLRLAEIGVLYGAIRGRLPLLPMAASATAIAPQLAGCSSSDDYYRQTRLYWSQVYREYLSRIGIYVPHDEQKPDDLVMTATCQLRIDPNPDTTGDHEYWGTSDIGATADEAVSGFKGGALWGVETKVIYNKIVSNPHSSSAELSNPSFTALGGYGTQLGRFDENRSTLINAAALGRTTTYSVERIGRIGVFWNRAKHVIIYERTVLPSRQFAWSQPRYAGRPIVRKVSEYVEFLEPDRDFGATDSTAPLPGFVRGFTCGERRRVNVDSNWGTAVSDRGWKVPLWNPAKSKDLPDVYPQPQLFLRVQTPEKDAKGNFVQQLCRITQPQNVFFYTSIVTGEGSNSDKWASVESVDFVGVPLWAPDANCYKSGDIAQRGAMDPSIPPGYQPITFSIQSPETGIHVTDGFAKTAMAANIRTVTLNRGPLPTLVAETTNARKNMAGITTAFEIIRTAIPDRTSIDSAAGDDLKKKIQAAVDSANTTLQATSADIQQVANDWLNGAKKQLQTNLATAATRLGQELDPKNFLTSAFGTDFDHAKAALLSHIEAGDGGSAWKNLTDKARGEIVHNYVDQLRMVCERAVGPIDPGVQFASVVRGAISTFDGGIQQMKRVLFDVTLWQNAEYLRKIGAAQAEFERVRTNFTSQLEQLRGAVVTFDAQSLTAGTSIGGVSESLRHLVEDVQQGFEELRTQQPKLNFDEVREQLRTQFEGRTKKLSADIDFVVQTLQKRAVQLPTLKNQFEQVLLQGVEARVAAVADIDAAKAIVEQVLGATALSQQAKSIAAAAQSSAETMLSVVQGWIASQQTTVNGLVNGLSDLVNFNAGAVLDELRSKVEVFRRQAEGEIHDYVANAVSVLRSEVPPTVDKGIKLLRAFGEPPQAPQLQFNRPEIAYLYDQVNRTIPITPVLARANQVRDALNAIDIQLPSVQLGDDLIPPDLKNFDLNHIFPSFAGLQLSNLFSGLKLPDVANKGVKVTHGWEPQTRRAWLHADVDVPISGTQNVFAFGPLALRLSEAKFQATADISASQQDGAIQQVVQGSVGGRWEVCLDQLAIVSFVDTQLSFDKDGKLHFNFDPQKIRLPDALDFVSKLFSSLLDPNSGVTIGPIAGGVRCLFDLPIPDNAAVTTGITGLRLATTLSIFVNENSEFAISLGFKLARRELPFNFSVFILGGSGYADVGATYVPATGKLTPNAQIAIACSASLAIALGPISGGVYVHFGIEGTLDGNRFHFGVFLLIAGHVSLLGVVSIDVAMYLEASYDNGAIAAWGHISYKIKMFMFTFEVNADVGTHISRAGQGAALFRDTPVVASLETGSGVAPGLAYAFQQAEKGAGLGGKTSAQRYVEMLA